jgi:hypothetical protein
VIPFTLIPKLEVTRPTKKLGLKSLCRVQYWTAENHNRAWKAGEKTGGPTAVTNKDYIHRSTFFSEIELQGFCVLSYLEQAQQQTLSILWSSTGDWNSEVQQHPKPLQRHRQWQPQGRVHRFILRKTQKLSKPYVSFLPNYTDNAFVNQKVNRSPFSKQISRTHKLHR